ncbi:MAG: agmatinase family protein [Bdellovibrionia bacterium]
MTKPEFDPNEAAGEDSGIFGLPFSAETAAIHLIPVPWEPTVSYGGGTSEGPELILNASKQVDLFDLETHKAYEVGYYMEPISTEIATLSRDTKAKAQKIIQSPGQTGGHQESLLRDVNDAGDRLNRWLYEKTRALLAKGKIVGVIGGDHSSPLGALQAFHEKYAGELGVLHIDAHADLRNSYEGFTWSHASIMYNLMTGEHRPKRLVQVGIRDFCEEEFDFIKARKDICTYFDLNLKRRIIEGETWKNLCIEIVSHLPDKVYVSFDIDGLDPTLCPNTGTPVPGGLSFEQALTLLRALHESKRTIVGFDLNEVSGGLTRAEWNGNVGARMLYKMCGWTAVTNQLYSPPAPTV